MADVLVKKTLTNQSTLRIKKEKKENHGGDSNF